MAAISVFSPSIDEKRWVSQGSRTFDSEHIIEIDDSIPTIFQVPKAMNETKPEAYTPQLLGLGPYHHLRPDLYSNDRQKLAQVKKFLQENSSKNFWQNFMDKMRGLEPVVRANYDRYLDLEGCTLDYIITVDSLYLLGFLGRYDQNTEAKNLEPGHLELAKDVVMLENQIPPFALVVMFVPFQGGGIKNLGFHEQLFPTIFLPTITLKHDSEVVLRNLVAYEAAVKSTFELAEYVDLMCGIMHTPKDAALLRKKGVIKGSLNDEEVFEIFNGISRYMEKSKEETASQKVVKKVKKMVEEYMGEPEGVQKVA